MGTAWFSIVARVCECATGGRFRGVTVTLNEVETSFAPSLTNRVIVATPVPELVAAIPTERLEPLPAKVIAVDRITSGFEDCARTCRVAAAVSGSFISNKRAAELVPDSSV